MNEARMAIYTEPQPLTRAVVYSFIIHLLYLHNGASQTANHRPVVRAVELKRIPECASRDDVGEFRRLRRGLKTIRVKIPEIVAREMVKEGHLQLGWSSIRVADAPLEEERCYRCWGKGHTRSTCKAPQDRSNLCFRCGKPGHISSACGVETPNCPLCAEAGRDSSHVFRQSYRVPAKGKGKMSPAAKTPTTSRTDVATSEEAMDVING
ncbi:hypothetical protein RUM43_012864 [Polyplax serrata]|uniref:CCHC-type domain-containing protein n=1 Tax=Polyplax serrata TaxID=468196 RepID=A0AAN8RZE0_POLSC